MDWNRVEGNWKQIKGNIKGEITLEQGINIEKRFITPQKIQ